MWPKAESLFGMNLLATLLRHLRPHAGEAVAALDTRGIMNCSMTTFRARIAYLALAAGFVGTAPTWAVAQGHSHAAPNGGQIQKIGAFEGELVVKGTDVTLYVVDSDEKKVDAAPLSATASVLAKGNVQKTVEMRPAGDNKLSGKVDFPVEGKFRATVSLRTASGEAGKARYSLDAK